MSFERDDVLEDKGIDPIPATFPEIVKSAQQVAVELFLNQAAICLKHQQDYMDYDDHDDGNNDWNAPLFQAMKSTTDILRNLIGYDAGVDPNRAIELLERMGYEVSGGSKSLPSGPDNISDINSSDGTSLAEQ